MWSTVKTTGFILSSVPFREADRRYAALTEVYGKVEFLGRGAQKPKAKLAPHLDSFALVQMEIVLGARSTTVIGVEREEVFAHVRETIEHRLFAQTLFTLLDKAIRPGVPDPELFHDVVDVVRFLNQQEMLPLTRSTFVLGAMILRVLRRLGYDVELHECLVCREAILPLSFRWHNGRGGLVCTDCVRKDAEDFALARGIPEEVVTLMRFGRDASLLDLAQLPLSGRLVEQFAQCVHDVYVYHVPAEVSMPFWSAQRAIVGVSGR